MKAKRCKVGMSTITTWPLATHLVLYHKLGDVWVWPKAAIKGGLRPSPCGTPQNQRLEFGTWEAADVRLQAFPIMWGVLGQIDCQSRKLTFDGIRVVDGLARVSQVPPVLFAPKTGIN